MRFTPDGARAFADAWLDRFATREAYWNVDGRPVLSLLNLPDFISVYGLAELRCVVRLVSTRIREQTGRVPYLIGVLSRGDESNIRAANNLPIDAATGYAMLPEWHGPPVQVYAELMKRRVGEWNRLQERLHIPFLPVVCAGWDATVRGERIPDLRAVRGFPWRPVVVGVTPERFGHFLDLAVQFNERWHPEQRIVFIHAWNEWTEASSIEPNDQTGDAFLVEIARRARWLMPRASDHRVAHAALPRYS